MQTGSVLGLLPPDPLMREADVVFGQPAVDGLLDAPKVRWVQVSSAGVTRYDTPEFKAAAEARGLALTNSSHVYDQACAEHVFSFMLAQARMLPEALATRTANGSREWLSLRGRSRLLQGQSVLIVGYGAIAECLVKLLAPFEMEITAVRRKVRGDELVAMVTPETMADALVSADHVVNILPDHTGSRAFFGTEKFTGMKKGAIFYNIGRGTTVDQEALVGALSSKRLKAAWLDVTDPEPLPEGHALLTLANCFITPHVAGGHHNESLTFVRHFLANLARFERGEPLSDRVM